MRKRVLGAAYWWLASAALVLVAPVGHAQTGTVVGTVSDRASGQPVATARVQVVGSATLIVLADARGRYTIRSVPSGPQTVRVSRIGFRPEVHSFTVAANDTTRSDFSLQPSAVELGQVLVTGTGGAVERRQVGASVASVDVAKITEQGSIPDFQRIMSGKVAGVRSVTVGGGVGSGQDLRIRGMASVALNQRPAIYIDGVRVDTRGGEWAIGTMACCSFTGGNSTDRLSDLNPADIERVEVLKGAAAGTLYGTEATNGVIQIFTKRGRSEQRTDWNLSLTTGYAELRHNLPTKQFPRFRGPGPDSVRALDANGLIEKGPYYGLDLSATGGTPRSTYFASASTSYEEGSIQPNDGTKASLRLNLTFTPTDQWTVETRSSYVRNIINELQAGNNWTALLGNAINGNPRTATEVRPYGEAWVPVADIKKMQTLSDADRWTGGITLNYNMTTVFTHRLTGGVDAVNDHKSRFFPFEGAFGPAGVTDGQRNQGIRDFKSYTFDYLGQLRYRLPGSIESTLSFGGQGFWEKERLYFAIGNKFAGPGVSTVSAAALTNAAEIFNETVNIGFLAQNRFAWNDRLFTTVGLRVDGNSAFGNNYGYKKYPNAQVSYDLRKHTFLPEFASAARIRAAWGQAGKMPGPFDSFQSFAPIPVYETGSGIVPLNPGNADLRPERSTELEFGFEAGLWNDRLGIEATVVHQRTDDAIVNKANPPSAGFTQSKRVNIGELQNKGWEASINYLVLATPRLEWSTSLRLDGNKNEVTDLGGIVLGGNDVRIGYPAFGVWSRVPTGFSVVTTGTTCAGQPIQSYGCPTTTRSDTAVFFGPSLPTFNAGLSNQVRWGSFQFYGLVSMEKGAWFGNSDRPYRIRQGGSDEYLSALGPNGERTFRADSIYQWASILSHVDKRDNVRLREISVSWQLPERISALAHVGMTSVTLSGQNLMWWDDCNCVDPNMNWAGASSFGVGSGFLAQPSPRIVRLSVRTRF
jgi:TonB-dependent SusC/RagA subfamily outer membrane receptor